MRATCIVCGIILTLGGFFAAVAGLFSFNLLLFLCGYNQVIYRSLLALNGVAAAWLAFWLIVFRPQNKLS